MKSTGRCSRRRDRRLLFESLEDRRLLNVDWRNPGDSLDVNKDGEITPNDVLGLINDINRNGGRQLAGSPAPQDAYLDPSGDGRLAPLDVLMVINHLNYVGSGPRAVNESGVLADEELLTITVGGTSGSGVRTMRLQIDAAFDTSAASPGEDVFLVYVVDRDQPSVTLLDRGQPGTAVFALSGVRAEFVPGLVHWDGRTLELDLSSLGGIDTARLKLQLLNSDGDWQSRVTVRPVSNELEPEASPGPQFTARATAVAPGSPVDVASLPVRNDVGVQFDNVRFDSRTGHYRADVRLRADQNPLGRTAALVLPGLPAGVSLANASGTTSTGSPYLNLAPGIPRGGLGAGMLSDPVRIELQVVGNQPFTLAPQVLAADNRPPDFSPLAPLNVLPGGYLEHTLGVTDPDGDRVTYSIRSAVALPIGTLGGNGTLVFTPSPAQVGTYAFTVVASDGALETSQPVTLNVNADPLTTTRVSGFVRDVEDTPLAGMQVEIGAVRGLTQADGSFLLDLGNGPVVSDTLKIRGETFPGPAAYPFIGEKLPLVLEHEVFLGVNNVISRPIFLPQLDVAGGTTVNPLEDTTVRQQLESGESVEVFVEAGTLMNQQGTPFTGVLSITEVPPELTPAALPANLLPDLVVTVQPGEMVFARPAPMTFPNTGGWAPGTLMDLWSINPVTGQFDDVGDMRVSTDGLVIETISGGVRNSSWHFPAPPPPTPVSPKNDPRTPDDCCDGCESGVTVASEVLLHSGALLETHDLVPYQALGQSRGLTLTYDSLRADPRPIVHFGYDNLAGGGGVVFAEMQLQRGDFRLEVPGFREQCFVVGFYIYCDVRAPLDSHFWGEVSGGLDVALQSDLREQPSGRYDYRIDVGLGRIQPDGPGFSLVGSSTPTRGKLVSVNSIHSPFGAGWGLNGLQQMIENPDGSLLLVDGDGGEQVYEPAGNGLPYQSPPGDFSKLEKLPDGRFRQTFPDQTVLEFNPQGNLDTITDRNGNATNYVYDGQGLLQSIVDPVGLETRFNYTAGRLATITDPAARVTSLQYDPAGNLTRITDPDGSFRSFRYDSGHHMVGEIDQRGATEEVVYGFHGRVLNVTRKDGTRSLFDTVQVQGLLPPEDTTRPLAPPYLTDLGPAVARYTDGSGNTVAKTLDQAGQETTATDGIGSMPTYERDANNVVTELRNGRGQLTEFQYDPRGNLTLVTDEIVRNSRSGGLLFPGATLAAGDRPVSVTTADFNGDGVSDLAAANRDSNDVSVLLGNGDGAFAAEQRFAVGFSPRSVTTGDFNGDGMTDLAVANYDRDGISVLLGNGTGTFADQQRFAVGDSASSVTTGDFNGDGMTDLAVANFRSFDVSVLLGNGDGTFAAQQRFAASDGPRSVTTGDFNGDGVSDLAVANIWADGVSVLLGNGDGTFAPQQFLVAGGDAPSSVTTGDFNGDGRTDLAVANHNSSDVSVLLGNGDGTFANQQPVAAGGNPYGVTTGDFNGDGMSDLAVANIGSYVSVLLGNGDGTFAAQQRFFLGFGLNSVTTGDFNADGMGDLAVANGRDHYVSVLLANGDGTFAAQQRFAAGDHPVSVTTADFNGDGVRDLAVANYFSNDVSVLLGNGNGMFSAQQRFAAGALPISVTTGDFNGDGVSDLAVANRGSGDVSVLLGNGDGTFADQQRLTAGTSSNSVTTADFNGDGASDLVVANAGSNDVSVLLGNGDGTFADQQRFAAGEGARFVTTGDFNGDGVRDLAVANYSSNNVSVLMGNGDGTFAAPESFAVGSNPYSVTTGDFNGDGMRDLVVSNSFSDDVSVLLGNGDGTFAAQQRFAVGRRPRSVMMGDFNGDGARDLAVANELSNDVSVLLGNGDGTFADQQRFAAGEGASSVTTDDFNGDGVSDLAVANIISDDVSVLLGNGNPGGRRAKPRTFSYDETSNQLTSVTDELGRKTLFQIDPANGNRLSTREVVRRLDSPANGEADDLLTTFTYTVRGLVDRITDPLGRVTDYDYDSLGRLVAMSYAVGTADEATQRFEYDAAGNPTAIIDENGNRTEFVYDPLNRLTRIVEADPDGPGPLASPETNFDYDARGNLIESTDATGSTITHGYDALDRLILTRDHLGNESKFAYDRAGNLIAATDPNGNTTRFRYDARNRLIANLDPDGGITAFRYDSDDNLLFLTDPNGNRTGFAYDSRSRLVREVDPLGEEVLFQYDAVDNLTKQIDRNGRPTDYVYDDLNRLVRETWVDGDNAIHSVFDKAGNLTSVVDAFGSLAFTHDHRDRVKTVDNGGTPGAPHVVLSYDYDDVGNVLSAVDTINGSAGATTGYAYDALNRMTRISQAGSGLADKRVDLAYNALGQFASIERYSDLAGTQFVASSMYAYDSLNRLTTLTHSNTAGPIAFHNFTYDSASRITRIADIDGATDYSYDDRDQLIGADRAAGDSRGDETYTYDANGNRIASHRHGNGYVTGPGNRLLSDGVFNYEYDREGNLIKRTQIVTGDYHEFTWDHRNRLVAVIDKTPAGTPTQPVTFSYDAFDRRINKAVDTMPADAVDAVVTHFVYDREDVILDFVDSDGGGANAPSLDQRYLHGPAIDQVLAQDDGAGSVQWHLTDHLGTVRELLDNTGVVVNHLVYDSFGNVVGNTVADSRYLLSGREFDVEIGLYFNRARYLDPSTAVFLVADPVGYASGDTNLRRYVGNNPLTWADPFGLEGTKCPASTAASSSGNGVNRSPPSAFGSAVAAGARSAGGLASAAAGSQGPLAGAGAAAAQGPTSSGQAGANGPYGKFGSFNSPSGSRLPDGSVSVGYQGANGSTQVTVSATGSATISGRWGNAAGSVNAVTNGAVTASGQYNVGNTTVSAGYQKSGGGNSGIVVGVGSSF